MNFGKTAGLILTVMMGTLSTASAQKHEDAVKKCLAYEAAHPKGSKKEIKPGHTFQATDPNCKATSKTCEQYHVCHKNLYYTLGAIRNNRRNNPDCKEAFEDTKFMKRAIETTIDCTDEGGVIQLGG